MKAIGVLLPPDMKAIGVLLPPDMKAVVSYYPLAGN